MFKRRVAALKETLSVDIPDMLYRAKEGVYLVEDCHVGPPDDGVPLLDLERNRIEILERFVRTVIVRRIDLLHKIGCGHVGRSWVWGEFTELPARIYAAGLSLDTRRSTAWPQLLLELRIGVNNVGKVGIGHGCSKVGYASSLGLVVRTLRSRRIELGI